MDKKKLLRSMDPEDMKGFEEFIEGQPGDSNFLPRPPGIAGKKEVGFEHFTFLNTDADRLLKLRNLLADKLPFAAKYEQGNALLREQLQEVSVLKQKLFEVSDNRESAYRKSLREIFDSFFEPPKA